MECVGPLIWFDSPPSPTEEERGETIQTILECTRCDYLIVEGSFHDESHHATPMLREGIGA